MFDSFFISNNKSLEKRHVPVPRFWHTIFWSGYSSEKSIWPKYKQLARWNVPARDNSSNEIYLKKSLLGETKSLPLPSRDWFVNWSLPQQMCFWLNVICRHHRSEIDILIEIELSKFILATCYPRSDIRTVIYSVIGKNVFLPENHSPLVTILVRYSNRDLTLKMSFRHFILSSHRRRSSKFPISEILGSDW